MLHLILNTVGCSFWKEAEQRSRFLAFEVFEDNWDSGTLWLQRQLAFYDRPTTATKQHHRGHDQFTACTGQPQILHVSV